MIDYQAVAKNARRKVLEMIYRAQTSHIGSNFSCIDILAVLFEIMDPKKDEFVASKGWAAASIYYFLAEKEIISKKDLERYCQPGETEYIGLIEPRGKFGLRFAGGSMGYGIAAAVGFALAKKMKKEAGKVYVLASDGEMEIGTTWESALLAAQHKLDNLVVVVDCNGLQTMGKTKEILNIEPLVDKFQAFGWKVVRVDGHDYRKIDAILRANTNVPYVIVADTVKGKGVSFMENNQFWHYGWITDRDYQLAIEELNA